MGGESFSGRRFLKVVVECVKEVGELLLDFGVGWHSRSPKEKAARGRLSEEKGTCTYVEIGRAVIRSARFDCQHLVVEWLWARHYHQAPALHTSNKEVFR